MSREARIKRIADSREEDRAACRRIYESLSEAQMNELVVWLVGFGDLRDAPPEVLEHIRQFAMVGFAETGCQSTASSTPSS